MSAQPTISRSLAVDVADRMVSAERARCLAIAMEVLQHGPGFDASKEFADGHSTAAQEIAAGITCTNQPLAAGVSPLCGIKPLDA